MKAVLVIDMPKNCLKCHLLEYDKEIGVVCRHNWTGDSRPDWCPLKPLPNKLPLESGSIMNTFKESTKYKHIGWNACLDVITGENDD